MTRGSLRTLPQSGERSGQVDLVKTGAPICLFHLHGALDIKPIITGIITDNFDFDQSVEAFQHMCAPGDTTIKSIIRVDD